jgi:hypothetical protein
VNGFSSTISDQTCLSTWISCWTSWWKSSFMLLTSACWESTWYALLYFNLCVLSDVLFQFLLYFKFLHIYFCLNVYATDHPYLAATGFSYLAIHKQVCCICHEALEDPEVIKSVLLIAFIYYSLFCLLFVFNFLYMLALLALIEAWG